MKLKGQDMPIVIVGNKLDKERETDLSNVELETMVKCDWENGYVECSAMENKNINMIFKEILNQVEPW